MFWAFCNYTLESKNNNLYREIDGGEKYKSPTDRELKWLDNLRIMANNLTFQFKTLIPFKLLSSTIDQTIDFH